MAFNYYYDFEDCFQQSGGTGTTLTYVVGSNEELTEGKFYTIFSISNPNQRVCGENLTASTSTAATHYSEVIYEFDSCGLCLSANTQIISVTGITNWNGGNLTLVADSRYIKGDIIHVDVVYDLSGTTTFINSPAQIVNVTPYTSTGSSIPDLIFYTPYDSFQQVFESKGVYYLVEDCSGGTQSVILSKQELLFQNTVINLPYGDSTCKFVVTALTQGDYSDISGVTTVLNSSVQYRTCADCLSGLYSGVLSDEFEQNAYESDSINSILQTYDGSVIIGGSGFTSFTGSTTGNTYSVGNIFKLDKFGNPDFTFNKISSGCLGLFNNNYIYTNNNSNFTLDGDFTIEFWMYIGSPDTDAGIISLYNGDDSEGWEIRFDSSNIIFYSNVDDVTSTFEPQSNQWNHLAIVREGSNITLFLNGSGETSSFSTSTISASTDTLMFIGTNYDKTAFLNSSVANVRISNVAVYTGDFKPKTSPLTIVQEGSTNISSISGNQTTLLLLFKDSNTLLDDSSNFLNKLYSYNPNVYYLSGDAPQVVTTGVVLNEKFVDSYLEIPLPSGYSLNFYGENYSSVYVGSNSYLTVGTGATEGGLILPDEIPTKIGLPGVFMSTLGDKDLDNETFITSILTGETEDGKFLVQVDAEYSFPWSVKSAQPPCQCYQILYQLDETQFESGTIQINYTDCDGIPVVNYLLYEQQTYLLYAQPGTINVPIPPSEGQVTIFANDGGCRSVPCDYNLVTNPNFTNNLNGWIVNNWFFVPNPRSAKSDGGVNSIAQANVMTPGTFYACSFQLIQTDFGEAVCELEVYFGSNLVGTVLASTFMGSSYYTVWGLCEGNGTLKFVDKIQCKLGIDDVCVTVFEGSCQCYNLYNTSGSIVDVTYSPCSSLDNPQIQLAANSYNAVCSLNGVFDFSTPNVVVVSSLASELEPVCDENSDCKADCFCFTGYSNNGQTAYLHSYTDCFGNVESGGVNISASWYDQYNPFKWCAKIEQPISTSSNLTWGPTYSACTEYLTVPYNTLDYQCPDFEIPMPCVCMRVRNNTPITSTNPNPNIPGSGWAVLSYEDCDGHIVNPNGPDLQLNVPPRANFTICAREILIANVNLTITNENILCEQNNDGDLVCPCQCYKVDRNSQALNALGIPSAFQTYRYKKCQLPTSNDGTIPDVLSTFNPTDYICAEIYSISSTTINNILNTTIPVLITELDHACNADSINLNPNFCVPTPTPTPTKTKTPTPTKTKTPTPTKTKTQTKTPTPTKTKTPTVTKTPTMTKTPTRTVPACRCHNITNNGANSFYTARACNSLTSSNFQITALSSVQRCFIEGTFNNNGNQNISATPTVLCVNCGGGQFSCGSCPSPTPTKTATPTKTVTRTVTRTVTPTKTATMTRTPTRTPLPVLPGCIVLVNSSSSSNLWYYNYTANTIGTYTQIYLPGNQANYPFRDIAISQTLNRYFGTYIVASNGVVYYWDVDFSTGTLISGPSESFLQFSPTVYGEGLGVSLSGNLLYLSRQANPGNQSIFTVNYSQLTATETLLINLTPGRTVSGDILATTNGRLIITTRDNNNLYVEQYTTDNTFAGTQFEGEFNLTLLDNTFGPNSEVDIFIDNGTFYLMRPQGGTEQLYSLSQDGATLQLVNTPPSIGTFRGIASYPECHNFEFTFVDPRCRPMLAVVPCVNNLPAPGNVSVYSYNMSTTLTQINLGQVVPWTNATSVRYSLDIAHTLDYDTNQGKMWVSTRTAGGTPGTFVIYEWDLSVTMQGVFTVNYVRQINLPAGYYLGRGLTALDNVTLISSVEPSNYATAASIIEIDISNPASPLNLTLGDIQTMFPLPLENQTFFTTQGNVTINNNTRVNVVGDMILTEDDNLIVYGKMMASNGDWAQTNFKVLLQYTYPAGVLQFIHQYPTNDGLGNNVNPISWNGTTWAIVSAANACNSTFPSLAINLINGTVGAQGISTLLPPNTLGPYGASSPRTVGGTSPCDSQDLFPNIL